MDWRPGVELENGRWLRAVRTARRMSQRRLADRAGMRHSSIDRIESGQVVPRLDTVDRLVRAAGCRLVVLDPAGRLCFHDPELERLRDKRGRRFPAHLPWGPTPGYGDRDERGREWWGWERIAWSRENPRVPKYTYWGGPHDAAPGDAMRWVDAWVLWEDAT